MSRQGISCKKGKSTLISFLHFLHAFGIWIFKTNFPKNSSKYKKFCSLGDESKAQFKHFSERLYLWMTAIYFVKNSYSVPKEHILFVSDCLWHTSKIQIVFALFHLFSLIELIIFVISSFEFFSKYVKMFLDWMELHHKASR